MKIKLQKRGISVFAQARKEKEQQERARQSKADNHDPHNMDARLAKMESSLGIKRPSAIKRKPIPGRKQTPVKAATKSVDRATRRQELREKYLAKPLCLAL